MPIYAYRCSACGHEQDVLQKMSDAPLSVCPSCGQSTYAKQVTAAGFQLKGSGWYVTDFRNGSGKSGSGSSAKPASEGSSESATTTSGTDASTTSATASSSTSAPASPGAASAGAA